MPATKTKTRRRQILRPRDLAVCLFKACVCASAHGLAYHATQALICAAAHGLARDATYAYGHAAASDRRASDRINAKSCRTTGSLTSARRVLNEASKTTLSRAIWTRRNFIGE